MAARAARSTTGSSSRAPPFHLAVERVEPRARFRVASVPVALGCKDGGLDQHYDLLLLHNAVSAAQEEPGQARVRHAGHPAANVIHLRAHKTTDGHDGAVADAHDRVCLSDGVARGGNVDVLRLA